MLPHPTAFLDRELLKATCTWLTARQTTKQLSGLARVNFFF